MSLLALPFPAIDPVAFPIGPITVKWYALAYIAGLIGGWYYARRLVLADGLWGVVRRPQVADIDDLVVWVALGVVLGGRVGYLTRPEAAELRVGGLSIEVQGDRPAGARSQGGITTGQWQHIGAFAIGGGVLGLLAGFVAGRRSA